MSSKDYPPDWNTRRKEVYQRDDYTCQNCGVEGGPRGNAELHAHHIVPKSKGGNHKKSNLKTLCKGCHVAVHGEKKAPSAETNQSKKVSQTSQKKISNPFKNCPICGSDEIGHHSSADETLQCTDCWSTLTLSEEDRLKLRVGPRGHNRRVGSFSSSDSGLTLLPDNWKLLSNQDDIERIDLDKLQKRSDTCASYNKKLSYIGLFFVPVLLIGIATWSTQLIMYSAVSTVVMLSISKIYQNSRAGHVVNDV